MKDLKSQFLPPVVKPSLDVDFEWRDEVELLTGDMRWRALNKRGNG
jgi:hypothetical protein